MTVSLSQKALIKKRKPHCRVEQLRKFRSFGSSSMSSSLTYLLLFMMVTPPLCNCFGDSRKELRVKQVSNQTTVQLGSRSSIQTNRFDPSRVVHLSWRPRVFLYKDFLTADECDHLIFMAQGANKTFVGKGNDSGKRVENRQLASSGSLDKDDNILARIEERISAWTLLPKEYSKPLKVLHYGLEDAKHRFDYFGNKSTLNSGEQLMATLVLHLSNVTRGGGILFPKSELRKKIWSDCRKSSSSFVKPLKGDAILFFTVHVNTSSDKSSLHERCPVLEGGMWCATKLFYVRPSSDDGGGGKAFSDTDSSNGTECMDEDENCNSWAALGECKKNPVFMVGSTDYYGTCRKSCNAC